MASDYFSHDLNARNDIKMRMLFKKYKTSGLGCFWVIIEILNENSGYILLEELPVIAEDLKISLEKLKDILENFKLFEQDHEKIWSESVLKRLKLRNEKSSKATGSANKRWGKDANALRPESERNALKESKVNKSKVKESKQDALLFDEFISFINSTLNKNYSGDKKSRSQFSARIREGILIGDIKTAIQNAAVTKYHVENNYNYLTPEFFTRSDKIENFKNANPVIQNATTTTESKQSAHERSKSELDDFEKRNEEFLRQYSGK